MADAKEKLVKLLEGLQTAVKEDRVVIRDLKKRVEELERRKRERELVSLPPLDD